MTNANHEVNKQVVFGLILSAVPIAILYNTSGNVIAAIIGWVMAYCIAYPIYSSLYGSKRIKKFISSQPNLKLLDTYISNDGSKGIAIDDQNKKIILADKNRANVFDYKDVVSSELIIDNVSLVKTNRGSQLVGVAAGSLLAGGIGAIIGGLSGSRRSIDNIKSIELKVTVNDMQNPIFVIPFLKDGFKKGFKKDGLFHKTAIAQAEKWQGRIELAIKQSN